MPRIINIVRFKDLFDWNFKIKFSILTTLELLISSDVHCEGIFRKCGSNKRIKDIRKLLNSHGNVIDWDEQEEFTVHDAASVLKQYISELPESPLLAKHISVHVEISSMCASHNLRF